MRATRHGPGEMAKRQRHGEELLEVVENQELCGTHNPGLGALGLMSWASGHPQLSLMLSKNICFRKATLSE